MSENGKTVKQKNLKPHLFPPGVSGNPKGRPPKLICLTSIFKELLTQINPNDPLGRQRLYSFAESALAQAENGKEGFFREIYDRIEGKVKQSIEGDINLNITGDMLAKAFREAQDEGEKSLKS